MKIEKMTCVRICLFCIIVVLTIFISIVSNKLRDRQQEQEMFEKFEKYSNLSWYEKEKMGIFEHRNLTWYDFNGLTENMQTIAGIYSKISYAYKIKFFDNNNINIDFIVWCEMNTNHSWVKNREVTLDTLNHEQTHYNICRLYARKTKKKFIEYKFTKNNYKNEIATIYNQMSKECRKLQNHYDYKIARVINRAGHLEWEAKILTELKKLEEFKFK